MITYYGDDSQKNSYIIYKSREFVVMTLKR